MLKGGGEEIKKNKIDHININSLSSDKKMCM